jgi:hypothetical protein
VPTLCFGMAVWAVGRIVQSRSRTRFSGTA